MEILLLVVIGIAGLFFAFRNLNKESSFGSHPLDALSKSDAPFVNNKTGDVVDVQPVIKRKRKVTPQINSQITDAVTQVVTPVKKTRKPRTVVEPVKETAKKATKTVKAAAITTVKKTPGRKPKSVTV